MTRGPLQLFRRRTLRDLAGFVAMLLLASHVLAATGLCVITASAGQPSAPDTVHESSAACPEHDPAGPEQAPAVKHYCPAEEPSPQARSVDLPPPQLAALVAIVSFPIEGAQAERLVQVIPAYEMPPLPLYARLQRLRL